MKKMSLSFFVAFLMLINIAFSSDGYLGLSIKSYTLDNQEGLRIVDVFNDGAASAAGLLENDFITKVNGEAVTHPYDLKGIVKQLQWGDEINLSYVRDGQSMNKDVILGYKAYKRTYEITKNTMEGNKESWYFKDETNIEFIEGVPVVMTKKIDGVDESIQLSTVSDYESLPQNFLDLTDKLFIIEETKKVQAERESNATNIVVFKEIISTEIPVSIIFPLEFREFNVYPNPNKGKFKMKLFSTDLEQSVDWFVYDIQGREVMSGTEMNNNGSVEKQITLPDVPSGNYLLYVKSGDKRISTQFIVE